MKKQTKGKDPAVLFYTSDFLSGTYTMNYEQRGKYITLLCIQHQKGFLTKQELAFISEGEEEVINKFTEIEGKFYNMKMYNETIRRKEYTENRLKNFQKKNHKDSHMGEDMNLLMKFHTETGTVTETETIKLENESVNESVNVTDTEIDTSFLDEVKSVRGY
jgi:hypothetical protein